MGDINDRIERELKLREAQKHRPLLEQECQSIRLEVLIGCRQTLFELQAHEKKVKLGSASKYHTGSYRANSQSFWCRVGPIELHVKSMIR